MANSLFEFANITLAGCENQNIASPTFMAGYGNELLASASHLAGHVQHIVKIVVITAAYVGIAPGGIGFLCCRRIH